jgi:hypothetical protein
VLGRTDAKRAKLRVGSVWRELVEAKLLPLVSRLKNKSRHWHLKAEGTARLRRDPPLTPDTVVDATMRPAFHSSQPLPSAIRRTSASALPSLGAWEIRSCRWDAGGPRSFVHLCDWGLSAKKGLHKNCRSLAPRRRNNGTPVRFLTTWPLRRLSRYRDAQLPSPSPPMVQGHGLRPPCAVTPPRRSRGPTPISEPHRCSGA